MFDFSACRKVGGNLLLAWSAAISLLLSVNAAQALLIGSMDKSATSVKLCLDSDCPLVDNHPFHPGRRIVVYEAKGKWVRVSRYIDRDQAGVNYPGFFLPEKVAMWMPVAELPAALSEQLLGMSVEDYEKQQAAKEKRRRFSFIPRRPALPKTDPRGPDGIFETADAATGPSTDEPPVSATSEAPSVAETESNIPVAEAEEIAVVETESGKSEREKQLEKIRQEIAKAKAAANTDKATGNAIEDAEVVEVVEAETIPEAEEPKLEPIEPQIGPKSATANVPKMSPRTTSKLASLKTEQPSEADVVVPAENKIPDKLTKRLRDKRLSALPSKPGGGLDLKSVIAMRHHALAMLEDEECSSIETGGPSLSLRGWIYIKCGGDAFLHQFEVE